MADVTPFTPLPAACATAFKEWAGVCDALADGRQSLILRKGGVSEAGGEFLPDHAAFWLYPTHVHQAEQGLRTPRPPRHPADPAGNPVVAIDSLAVVAWVERVESLDQLAPLAAWHDWTEATVRDRFHYRRPGLWALGVRTFRRPGPRLLDPTPDQLGCRTWVPLAEAWPTDDLTPVLDEAAASDRLARIRDALHRGSDRAVPRAR